MEPFGSVEEAILFSERTNAAEFCCIVLWRENRYAVLLNCRAPRVFVSIEDHGLR